MWLYHVFSHYIYLNDTIILTCWFGTSAVGIFFLHSLFFYWDGVGVAVLVLFRLSVLDLMRAIVNYNKWIGIKQQWIWSYFHMSLFQMSLSSSWTRFSHDTKMHLGFSFKYYTLLRTCLCRISICNLLS